MLTKEEYSKACDEMQRIWKKEMDRFEATAIHAFLNGDKSSMDSGKQAADRFKIVKDTVDLCISVISTHYTDWNNDAKTNKKTDNATK